MEIRAVQPSDAAEWLRLRMRLWIDSDPDSESREIEHFLAVPQRPPLPNLHAAFVCARLDGGLCGLAEVSIQSSAPGCTTDRIGYLEAWYVDPDYRGQGIGRALAQRGEAWAYGHGCREMASDTTPSYPISPSAHIALGYQEVERYFRKDLAAPTEPDRDDSNTQPTTNAPVTYADIVSGLRRLGMAPGAAVEVHSSLSAFGWVEGGATAVIDALMDVITPEGTLMMSAYPVSPAVPLTEEDRDRGITWKVRLLPMDSSERTGMGRIADTFRQRADVRCGSEFFRTCAWGRDAEWHCEGYQGLLAVDGWCLLLGVGIDRCSSMHVAESVPLPAEIAACWVVPEHVQRAYDPQVWGIGYGGTPDDAWQKVWEEADRRGLIRHCRIGQALCHYFRARSVVGLYRRWRQTDPYGLYGMPRPA